MLEFQGGESGGLCKLSWLKRVEALGSDELLRDLSTAFGASFGKLRIRAKLCSE
jgi:hypothetical protein